MTDVLADLPRGISSQKDSQMFAPKAQWYSSKALASSENGKYTPDKIFIGSVNGELIGVKDDRHMMTIAGSRAGKGRSCIIPNLLHYSGSVLVIDPKGENADITATRRAELGQSVYVLDPFSRCGKHCDQFRASFNPLDLLKIDSPTLIDDAALIADALVIPSGGDSHWDDSAKSFIEGLILHVVTDEKYQNKRNLVSVYEALLRGETIDVGDDAFSGMNGLEIGMCSNPAADGAIQSAGIELFTKPEKERESVISATRKHLNFLRSKQIQKVMGNSSFSLDDLQKSDVSVFLCLPAGRLSINRRWLRLFINLAFEAFERVPKRKDQPPILMILDEFPVLGHMRQIEDAAGQIAGFGVKLWPIIQDLSQLKGLYKDRWETFLGNSGVIQCFGNNEQTTTEWISKRLGKTSFKVVRKNDLTPAQAVQGASGESWATETHDLLTPEEVSRFFARESGRQIIIMSGRNAIALERVNYDQHLFFNKHLSCEKGEPDE